MPIHGYPGGVISATPPTVNSTTASGVWTTEKQLQYQAQGVWPPAVAQPISRSLRFNSADSTHLTRTPASASNQKTWTWSGWCKRSTLSTLQSIFSSRSGSAGCNLQWGEYSTTNDYIIFYSETVNVFVTTPVYRDASAWYHIVLALDTTQATASNRVKLYINGTQVTALTSTSYPSQNADLRINSANQHCIGSTTPSAEFLNGYLTEINFVDGQALTPSSFGQTNSITGVWEPKAYSGTYGTNGFYLNFSDNSGTTSTTLGKDYSGNSNNWTPNNFSVTAGVGNDSLVDSPTSYGSDTGAGGTVRGNYCTWNPLFTGGSSPSARNGNLDFKSSSSGWNGIGPTIGVSSGKWYWEVTVVSGDNGYDEKTRIGIQNLASTINQFGEGSGNYQYESASGQFWNGSSYGAYGSTYTNNDVVGIALDMDAGTLVFYKNNVSQGTAKTGITGTWGPFVALSSNPLIAANFGQRPFAYTAPSGFKALCTQNLSTPTVVQGDDYFNTIIWSGDSVSGRSLTGVGFQPDWVWIKNRNAPAGHNISDAVRGANKRLNSDNAGSEVTNSGYGYTSAFNSDGFVATAGTVSGYELGDINMSGRTYVAWNWKANGAGSSNTAGSITSTVSANTTAGFSIVTYTGNGSATATVGHGLGAVPAMFIVKSRSNATDWIVYHVSLGNNTIVKLNTAGGTFATDYWQDTTPSSTLLYLNGAVDTEVCGNGRTFVAYCFAAVPGYSAFGSYTGNGTSGDGPFVYLGFRPAWLLIRMTSSGNDWVLFDSKRNTYNTIDDWLYPNLSNSEQSNDPYNNIDFVSNGFKIRGLPGTYTNSSGATYIYAAFAENPFKYALAR